MEYGIEDFWYGMEMEWKKIARMEYGKIVFHSIPYHALPQTPIGYLPQNSPPPIADFWLRACCMLFVYVAVELNTLIMLI